MNIIKINAVKVLEFPEVKFAHGLLVTEAKLKLVDEGATVVYHLLDEENRVIYQGGMLELTNEELANWKDSDTQLIDAVLTKLKLTKVVE